MVGYYQVFNIITKYVFLIEVALEGKVPDTDFDLDRLGPGQFGYLVVVVIQVVL